MPLYLSRFAVPTEEEFSTLEASLSPDYAPILDRIRYFPPEIIGLFVEPTKTDTQFERIRQLLQKGETHEVSEILKVYRPLYGIPLDYTEVGSLIWLKLSPVGYEDGLNTYVKNERRFGYTFTTKDGLFICKAHVLSPAMLEEIQSGLTKYVKLELKEESMPPFVSYTVTKPIREPEKIKLDSSSV